MCEPLLGEILRAWGWDGMEWSEVAVVVLSSLSQAAAEEFQ